MSVGHPAPDEVPPAGPAEVGSWAPYRLLFATNPHPMWIFDAETLRFLEVNDAALALYGYTCEEFLALTLEDIRPPEAPGTLRAVLDNLPEDGPALGRWVHRTRTGRQLDVEIAGEWIEFHGRRARLAVAVDHTGAVAAHREAEAQTARYRALFEYAPDAIVVFDMDAGRFVEANSRACELFGYSPEAFLALGPQAISPPSQPGGQPSGPAALALLTAALEGKLPAVEWVLRDAAGTGIPCEVRLVRMPPYERRLVLASIIDIRARKEAETEAVRRHHQFRSLAENSPDLIVRFDRDCRRTYVNRAVAEASGLPVAQLLGRRPSESFPGNASLLRWEQMIAHVFESGASETFEGRASLATADEFVQTHLIPEFGPDGQVESVLSITRDLTEVRRAIEARSLLSTIVESATDALIAMDREGRVISWNRGAGQMLGIPPEAALGRNLDEVLGAAGAGDRDAAVQQVIASGKTIENIERSWRTPDGSTLTAAVSFFPIFNDAGEMTGVGGVGRDITARKQAESALRESEARLRHVIEASSDLITQYGADLKMEFGNQNVLNLLAPTGHDPIGRRFDELGLDPAFAGLLMTRLIEARDTRQPVEFQYQPPSETGEVWHRARVTPQLGEGGHVTHILTTSTDITRLKKAEDERRRLDQQMQQTQKLESLGVLAGGIAHDFNNLLVAILGNAGLALLELPPESPARTTIQAIETAAQRAAELTRQMLAYSGKGKFVIEPLDLSRLVEEMAHLLEVSVSKRAVLKYRFARSLPPIEGDATQVRQVIMNLITNASDAIGERSGVISVSTGMMHADAAYLASSYIDAELPEGDYVFLEVADTGSGMDAATMARIFDPFFTTKFTGRGLGLAAVLGIVRGHGGAIKIYSEPGRGTTFKVLLPAMAGVPLPEGPAAEAPAGAPAGPGALVLVVDDDDTVRAVTRRMLERAAFTVVDARDGEEALRAYREEPAIACVLLDMTMPRMDGEECFRELRRMDPGVRVVLMSGYNEQDATERFVGKGLAAFIQKPFRHNELATLIHRTIEGG